MKFTTEAHGACIQISRELYVDELFCRWALIESAPRDWFPVSEVIEVRKALLRDGYGLGRRTPRPRLP